jgi:predicted ATPase/class 3 adenylate cyclase
MLQARPTGTVTFLFTDIEGSTRLAQTLGEAWAALLGRHRAIVRAALAESGGTEVQTEGDGFFAVFASAPAAVLAAVRAQRGLAAEAWPAGAPIRVRMGLHTGEGRLDEEGLYIGTDVHRAARVSAAAHGGQVLLTEATRVLAEPALPPDVRLRALGEHRLRDLQRQALSQLVIDGLPDEFPALRSLDAMPNNLPLQLTSFVGRETEMAVAVELLSTTRLLTLSGPGGTGKTRLALQVAALVAQDFPDGVWFVPLEPLRDPDLVLPTVARTLAVLPRPGEPAIDSLAAAVANRRLLLVLDNFEQVVAAAGDVASLLRACPELRVIVTSRTVLRVAGEQEYVVSGLPTPPDARRLSRVELEDLPATIRHPDAASLDQYEAVRLFVARATAVRPDFSVTNENAPAVAGITARLQGMPLAIELAAARVKLLTPDQVLERLEQQLGILTSSARDLPDRQRTLRGAIAWSCDLLEPDVARLLARLSVFRGSWTLHAAEAVTRVPTTLALETLEGLGELVDQSLVRRTESGPDEPRFGLLESVREFAAELLEAAGETAALRAAHAAVYLGLAEAAAPHLQGAEQRRWLDRLEAEHDDLRAAIEWALETPDPPTAARLAYALWRFWQQRGYLEEARLLLDTMAAQGWQIDREPQARLAEATGGVAYWQADLAAAARWYDEALRIRREDARDAEPETRRQLANALYNRGYVAVAEAVQSSEMGARPDPAARVMLEEALALYEDLGDQGGQADLLWGLGGYHMFAGAAVEAEPLFRRSLELHRAAGRRTMEAWSLHMLSTSLLLQEDYPAAGDAETHALRHFREAGDVSGITLTLDVLAIVALAEGQRRRGGRLWGAARQLQAVSGTGLAEWDARIFALLPFGVRNVLAPEELEALAAEGAALSLSETVAYALGEHEPFGDDVAAA